MNEWAIIGHEWAVTYLRNSMASGHLAHAYLLSGPAGIGKRLFALRMAQVFNCERGNNIPCLQCHSCQRIERGNHPDVRTTSMETQAALLPAAGASRQKELKIDTIREWQRDMALRPYEGRRRVFILHDAERLSEEASNAMLKTLEEPPSFVTMILVADRANVLPTIASRCQLIRLRPLPRSQVIAALSACTTELSPDAVALIAALSEGRIGWALQRAQSPQEIEQYRAQIEHLFAIQTQPRHRAFLWAEERAKEYRSGEQETVFGWLELWQKLWRDVLLVATGCPEYITHVSWRDELENFARRYPLPAIYQCVRSIGDTIQQLRENVNPQLALEHLLLRLPKEDVAFGA